MMEISLSKILKIGSAIFILNVLNKNRRRNLFLKLCWLTIYREFKVKVNAQDAGFDECSDRHCVVSSAL